jgi:hypothetical protein
LASVVIVAIGSVVGSAQPDYAVRNGEQLYYPKAENTVVPSGGRLPCRTLTTTSGSATLA